MDQDEIIYSLSVEDIVNVSEQIEIPFDEKDIPKISEFVGGYFGDMWFDAIEQALNELEDEREETK